MADLDGRGVLRDGRGIDHPLSPREAHPEFKSTYHTEEAKKRGRSEKSYEGSPVIGWRKRHTPAIGVLYTEYGQH